MWAGEDWERNLALDFMPDWPIFKREKVISNFFTLSGFSQNRYVIELSVHRTNLMGCISCSHDPPKPQTH